MFGADGRLNVLNRDLNPRGASSSDALLKVVQPSRFFFFFFFFFKLWASPQTEAHTSRHRRRRPFFIERDSTTEARVSHVICELKDGVFSGSPSASEGSSGLDYRTGAAVKPSHAARGHNLSSANPMPTFAVARSETLPAPDAIPATRLV